LIVRLAVSNFLSSVVICISFWEWGQEKVHQLEEIKNQILSSVEQQEDVKADPSNAPPAPSPVTVVATSGGELPDDSEIHSIEEGNILVP
jgi:hypothetical protein